jgi:hypothetical protein
MFLIKVQSKSTTIKIIFFNFLLLNLVKILKQIMKRFALWANPAISTGNWSLEVLPPVLKSASIANPP